MARAKAVSTVMVALALWLGAAPALAEVEVNTCGQTFKGRGFLSGDLDCTGFAGSAVNIDAPAGTLDLKGFTITGGWHGVHCMRSCKVFGPGTISDNVWDGVLAERSVTVVDVTITNHIGEAAVEGQPSWNSKLTGRVKVVSSTLANNTYGVRVNGAAKVIGSSIVGNVYGVKASRSARISGSTVAGNNLIGVQAAQLRGDPPWCERGKVVLQNSIVTGNAWLNCTPGRICADVVSCTRPVLRSHSTCDTSLVPARPVSRRWWSFGAGDPWGVCSLD